MCLKLQGCALFIISNILGGISCLYLAVEVTGNEMQQKPLARFEPGDFMVHDVHLNPSATEVPSLCSILKAHNFLQFHKMNLKVTVNSQGGS